MEHFTAIKDYCKAIQILPPKYHHFDIRSFEENMEYVIHKMPPFRHEFYAIAIKHEGEGKVISGHHTNFPEGNTIFFNTPFQILSWDIVPNWQGYYIMFSQEFIAQSVYLSEKLSNFPFLRMDKSIPFEVNPNELQNILSIYENIWQEYHSKSTDKFQIIEPYVLLLLNYVKRYFLKQVDNLQEPQTTELSLLTRYQSLIQESFYPEASLETFVNLRSPQYYAQKLHVHPNHLNAVVKKITGLTALNHIHQHILKLAKGYLVQTELSIKEIAYTLYFESPNNFNTFFKKNTSLTPLQYRKRKKL